MTKLAVQIESDEPVMLLVIPLRKAAPRSVPPMPVARRIVDTTAELAEESNVVPLRRAVGG